MHDPDELLLLSLDKEKKSMPSKASNAEVQNELQKGFTILDLSHNCQRHLSINLFLILVERNIMQIHGIQTVYY